MFERIKEQFKAKIRTHTDTTMNNIISSLKIVVNQSTDEFTEKIWPALIQDIKIAILEEHKRAESTKKLVEAEALKKKIEAQFKDQPTLTETTNQSINGDSKECLIN